VIRLSQKEGAKSVIFIIKGLKTPKTVKMTGEKAAPVL